MKYLKILPITIAVILASHFSVSSIDEILEDEDFRIPYEPELKRQLNDVATDIANIIIENKPTELLKYVDKDEWLVNYGGDLFKNHDEVEADLKDTTSDMYCFIFDISCYKGDNEKSIRDYLIEASNNNMTIEISVNNAEIIRGVVEYKWDGKPEDLWVYKFPNPEFVYTDNGWKIISLFAE